MNNVNCTAFAVQKQNSCQMGKINSLVFGSVGTPENQLLSVFAKFNQSGKFWKLRTKSSQIIAEL